FPLGLTDGTTPWRRRTPTYGDDREDRPDREERAKVAVAGVFRHGPSSFVPRVILGAQMQKVPFDVSRRRRCDQAVGKSAVARQAIGLLTVAMPVPQFLPWPVPPGWGARIPTARTLAAGPAGRPRGIGVPTTRAVIGAH